MSTTPTLDQVHFRVRTDTATVDTAPTWAAAEDTNVSLAIETTFRIRFVVQNTGTAASTSPTVLRVSKNAGAYTAVTTSTGATLGAQSDTNASTTVAPVVILSSNYRLTAGAGTVSNGLYDEAGSAATTITNGQYKELEFGLILKTAGAAASNTFDFRLYNSTTAFTTYTQTPRISVPPAISQDHYRIRIGTDTVNISTPTWGAAEDTTYYPGTETDFRIRFVVSNTGTVTLGGPYTLYLSKNGGAYAPITTSSTGGVQSNANASTSTDETAITTASFRLTAGTGSSSGGIYDETGSATSSLPAGLYTEFEYGLIIKAANVAAGDTLDFRVYNSTTAFGTYTRTPRITIPSGPPNHACLANDISSASSVTQPALQQVHGILANDVKSNSAVANPALISGVKVPSMLHNYRMRRT